MAGDDERLHTNAGEGRPRRENGLDLSRLLALSDGVFAFALTLLVINFTVPTGATLSSLAPSGNTNQALAQYLVNQRGTFFAFALAFAVIGTWWAAHNRIFRMLLGFDRAVTSLNLAFLLFIALTPFEVGLLAQYGGTPVAVGLYGGTQALAGTCLLLLRVYLVRGGRGLLRAHDDHLSLSAMFRTGLIAPIGFGVSVPAALLSPLLSFGIWFVVLSARELATWRSHSHSSGSRP